MSSANAPQGWEPTPLQYVCRLNPSVDFHAVQEEDELTFLPMDRVKSGFFIPNTEKFSKYAASYNAFENGDIVLAKVTPCFENGNVAIAENLVNGKGFGSSELFVVRATSANRKFLFYYFQSSIFKQEGEASMTGAGGLKRVSADLLRTHRIALPSPAIQQKVADYLDREIARIDALVIEKERMLELLDEKRAALISRAVTQGLDPKVKMKASGFDWLGEVPEGWEVRRFKYLCELNPPVDPSRFEDDVDITFLPMDQVKNGYFIPNTEKANKRGASYSVFSEGDIIFAKVTPCFENGNIAVAENLVGRVGFGSSELFVARPHGAHQKFIFYYLQSALFKQQGEASMTGAGGLKRVSPDMVRDHHLAVPSLEKQKRISAYLDEAIACRDKIEIEMEASCKLLTERRAALITAAVTGQIPEKEMMP